MTLSHSFLWLSSIPLYEYIYTYITSSSFIHQWTFRLSWLLWIVLQWTQSVYIFLSYSFPWIHAKEWIAGSYGREEFFLCFFFGHIHTIWKFSGQELNLSCCRDNTGSLTWPATVGTQRFFLFALKMIKIYTHGILNKLAYIICRYCIDLSISKHML